MSIVKLKDDVNFNKLIDYRFTEDPSNCDPGDHYYHLNNYYIEKNNFRVTVNTLNRHIDVLCLPKDGSVHNMYNIKPLFDLLSSGLVEVKTN